MARIEFKVKFPSDAELDRLFATVPVLERYKVLDKAARASAKVVAARAKVNAPRSSKTGTTEKWSRAMTTTGTPKNKTPRSRTEKPLWQTVGVTIKKYENTVWAGVGPTWPSGNKVFYNSAHLKGGERVEVQWGRRTGRTRRQTDNWLKRSHDETLSQQKAVMKDSIKKSLDEMMPNG
jgi:hypothetical protein